MKYTVKQLAKLASISVRTLHYYDEVGLLKPSYVESNGYRYYEQKEVIKLQQILFFRELEFSLEEINKMVNSPHFDTLESLKDQKKLLELKKERIQKLLGTIDTTIKQLKGGESMNTDDLFASFGDQQLTEYMQEAKQRWGKTDAWKQSRERTKHWTKADYERIKKEGLAFTQELAKAMDKDIASPEVQDLIAKHHQGIEAFYDCSWEMYRGLADMYVADARFTAYYDKVRPGLAKWLRDAIYYYCDVQEKKNLS